MDALCRWLGLARSSYYYQAQVPDETALLYAMEQILMRWPFYGYVACRPSCGAKAGRLASACFGVCSSSWA